MNLLTFCIKTDENFGSYLYFYDLTLGGGSLYHIFDNIMLGTSAAKEKADISRKVLEIEETLKGLDSWDMVQVHLSDIMDLEYHLLLCTVGTLHDVYNLPHGTDTESVYFKSFDSTYSECIKGMASEKSVADPIVGYWDGIPLTQWVKDKFNFKEILSFTNIPWKLEIKDRYPEISETTSDNLYSLVEVYKLSFILENRDKGNIFVSQNEHEGSEQDKNTIEITWPKGEYLVCAASSGMSTRSDKITFTSSGNIRVKEVKVDNPYLTLVLHRTRSLSCSKRRDSGRALVSVS